MIASAGILLVSEIRKYDGDKKQELKFNYVFLCLRKTKGKVVSKVVEKLKTEIESQILFITGLNGMQRNPTQPNATQCNADHGIGSSLL